MDTKTGICGLCGSACLVDAQVEDNMIKRVEGAENNKFSQGKLCVKGNALKQYTHSKERLLYPMRRIGPRGGSDFERISWDEALDTIAENMEKTKKDIGAKHTMIYVGHPKWFRPQLSEFAAKYGTPNYGSESSTCAYALMLAAKTCFGRDVLMPRPDLKNCKTLLVWGVNPKYSGEVTSGMAFQRAADSGKNIIVVDPRCTPTTEEAHIHLRPMPGTDGALALAMAKVLIDNGLHDIEYIEKYGYGFEEYREYVSKFDLATAEEITGINKDLIEEASFMYGENTPSAIMTSASPVVHNINGVQNARAVLLLNALIGAYGSKGGVNPPGPTRAYLNGSFMGPGSKIRRTDADKDLNHKEFPAWSDLIYEEAQLSQIGKYLNGQGDYPIKNLIAFGMNHHMWPQPDNIERGFEELDFFVNADPFFTETSRYADIVLPVATSVERDQILVQGQNNISFIERIIDPLGEARNDMEIIIGLSKRLGYELGDGYEDYDDYLRSQLKTSSLELEELKDAKGGLESKAQLVPISREEILDFKTPTGKIEFTSSIFQDIDKDHHHALPTYKDFREDLPMADYPLVLASGSRKPQLFHSRTYRLAWINNLEHSPVLDIHPRDGEKFSIKDGERVRLVSPVGQMEIIASYDTSCLEGVVNVYHGAGEKDINYLIDDDYIDPISGFPGFKSYCCRIEKLEDRNE